VKIKQTELEHTLTVQKSIISKNRHKRWWLMVCWNSTKIYSSKHEQNI